MLKIDRQIVGTEPLTLEEVKEWLRVEFDEEDTLINSLSKRARELIERYLNISLVASMVNLEASGREVLQLPYSPIDAIGYVNDLYTDEPVEYEEKVDGLHFSYPLPDVSVAYTTKPLADEGVKLGLLEVIAYLYENRGDEINFASLIFHNTNLQPYRDKLWF